MVHELLNAWTNERMKICIRQYIHFMYLDNQILVFFRNIQF